MFPTQVYIERRRALSQQFREGLLLFLGNAECPANCGDNPYRFRQDSNFLYYWGVDRPDLAALLDIDEEQAIVFGDGHTLDSVIWEGPRPGLAELCQKVGIEQVAPAADLADYVSQAQAKGRTIHILPSYRPEHTLAFQRILGFSPERVAAAVSTDFIKAVIAQRSIKSDAEIEEIEVALGISARMHALAMSQTQPGKVEREIVAALQAVAYAQSGKPMSFNPIFSVRGETLHNPWHHNTMAAGQMVVNDSGAQTALYYNSDITRTIPVSGRFTGRQREIYDIVLTMQSEAIGMIAPAIAYRDVHVSICRRMAARLKSLGLMRGDTDAAVDAGAHALFMPHGLGHMLGLDVHDMDALGEDYVGYTEDQPRSTQFGLNALRMGRILESGFVITVEPGIYFIPALIDRWREERRFTDFIAYDRLEAYRDFGGIRIEDDVLVTATGARVLGPPIPKTIEEVEAAASVHP